MTPTDRIQVNAGGRLFETTTTTLMSSGSKFFQALLGLTGTTLAGRGGEVQRTPYDAPLFLDRDPDLFADVLYFMRSNRLSASTRRNVDRLEDLLAEADFFVYDALQQACDDSLEQQTKRQASAKSCWIKVDETPRTIPIPPGQMIYICSAQPTWKEPDMPPHPHPDGYFFQQELTLKALMNGQTFQLLESKKSYLGQGEDQVHSNLPISLSCPEEGGPLALVAEGRGVLDVVYWIGHTSAIPIKGSS
jgi:hypothetical protein